MFNWTLGNIFQWNLNQNVTSLDGNIFRVTGHLYGEFTGEFPAQRPVTRSFDVFFDLRSNKRLSKQSWGWWSDTPSSSLWRHRNEWQPFLFCHTVTQHDHPPRLRAHNATEWFVVQGKHLYKTVHILVTCNWFCVTRPLTHLMYFTWWRHQMETFSALLAICAGNSPVVTGEFLAQRPVTQSFDVFFNPSLNKRLSKQTWGWWFEMLSRPLWRHSNVYFISYF